MDESTLFANIFETGRDPLEWLEDYIRRFAESSGNIKLFPGWFGKFNTGYKGFGVGKVTSTTGDDGDIGKYRGFLYTDVGDAHWTPGLFARPDLATMEVFIQLRDCVNLKIWLTEYVKANADIPAPIENNLFPKWWVKRVNPNWESWGIFEKYGDSDSERVPGQMYYFLLHGPSGRSVYGSGVRRRTGDIIADLVNFIWDEVESVKFKEIK